MYIYIYIYIYINQSTTLGLLASSLHAAWESLQESGFQSSEPGFEAKDDLEAMQERMTNLQECFDFAEEQVKDLERAVGYYDESDSRKFGP